MPEMSTPTLLETAHLQLRRLHSEDLPVLLQILGDPEMMRYLGQAWSPDQIQHALAEWTADWGNDRRWTGLLAQKDTGEALGIAGLTENTIPNETGFEISWFILPAFQRQGFAAEITRGLCWYAFSKLNAARLVVEINEKNFPAAGLLTKLGFRFLGERQHIYDDLPEFSTQALWELSKEAWEHEATVKA